MVSARTRSWPNFTLTKSVFLTTFAFFYALPAYVALGALWRLSVMVGHPFNEAKNKKWRKIILFGMFTPAALVGIILGIVGMGKSRHFHTAHGIFGLLAFLFFIPTVITSFMRLRTAAPIPPPSAFAGIKQLPKLLKGPHKIHLISAFFVQQTLAFGMISWIQGFSDLRSISLCVVDAILTAPAVVGLVNFVLFLQVSSMALLGLRAYFEQRIVKKEQELEKGDVTVVVEEKRDLKRNDTIKTFGFDLSFNTDSPERPPLTERKTVDLLGREDSKIGWPSNVRKFGEEDAIPGRRSISVGSNPFIDPNDKPITSPRIYNPKLGGFEDDRSPALPNFPRPPSTNYGGADRDMEFRPSSEIDPQSRYISLAPAQTPALPKESEEQVILRRYESFSRPLNTRPSGENVRIRYDGMQEEMPNPYGYRR